MEAHMLDLTDELQRVADDAASWARALAADDVIRLGHRMRRRSIIWRSLGGLSVVGLAAAVAVAVMVLAPAGHPPAAQLAAWTVVRQADGNVVVSVRELTDPAGLQGTLRADGVPASVTLIDQQNPACQPYPGGTPQQGVTPLLKHVFPVPYANLSLPPSPAQAAQDPPSMSPGASIVVIDPAALPGHTGVQIGVSPDGKALLLPQVVYAGLACTGTS
jgi:hypothetical protein